MQNVINAFMIYDLCTGLPSFQTFVKINFLKIEVKQKETYERNVEI